MLSAIPLFFALLHLAHAAPASSPHPDTHSLQKRLADGPKIAIGICVPAAALVLGLAVGILWFYPAQRRKLREQNARRELIAAQAQRRGSEHVTLPVYKEHEGSEHELDDVEPGSLPTATTGAVETATPDRRYGDQLPVDARHAALTL